MPYRWCRSEVVLKSWNLSLHCGREQGVIVELHQLKSCYHYFAIILQSSVGTLEGHSESVCIGRNRCATYTNHVIKFRNHICKLAGCGARGPTLVGYPVSELNVPN